MPAKPPSASVQATGVSHWAAAAARAKYAQTYDAAMGLWPAPVKRRFVTTPFGEVHCLESGAPESEAVILLPAAALGAIQWYPQAAALGSKYRVLAIDLLGDIGLSTQARPIRSRIDAADWIAAFLDALEIGRAVFIGSSFGGFLAANFAAHSAQRVSALGLIAPAATITPLALSAELMIRFGNLVPFPASVRPALRAMLNDVLPDMRLVALMESGVAGFRYDRSGVFPVALPVRDLNAIEAPTLVVIGGRERIYPARRAREHTQAKLPRAHLAFLDGVGHLPNLECPQELNAVLHTFLTTLAGQHDIAAPRTEAGP